MIVFGYRTKVLATFVLSGLTCRRCGSGNEVLCIARRYYHISWILRFPGKKTGLLICADCKVTQEEEDMSSSLLDTVDEKKKEVKTPWHYYTGLAGIAIVVVAALFAHPNQQTTPAAERSGSSGYQAAPGSGGALTGTYYLVAAFPYTQTIAYQIVKVSPGRDSLETRLGQTSYHTRDKAEDAIRDHTVDRPDYSWTAVMPTGFLDNLIKEGRVREPGE
ncbi:MAG: zinc-ribbon protein [Chlorobi bacterium]|jgi:hypothetical protein|nr:zinc-ribbon protein [Chlorobiota bacterium]